MDQQTPQTPSRPLILLGRLGESLTALLETMALRDCFVVATPETSSVEELLASLQPTAALLEASEFYLDGRALSSRLQALSPGSRIFFLDVDRTWALWMEPECGTDRGLRIVPCDLPRAGEGLMDLLNGPAAFRALEEPSPIPLEPAG